MWGFALLLVLKNCELIRDSSLWHSNFIPLVRDSIVIIGSRSVYTFGSWFNYNHWVKVCLYLWFVFHLGKNLNFSFLGQVFQYCLLGLKVCRLRFASFQYCLLGLNACRLRFASSVLVEKELLGVNIIGVFLLVELLGLMRLSVCLSLLLKEIITIPSIFWAMKWFSVFYFWCGGNGLKLPFFRDGYIFPLYLLRYP